MIPGIMYIHATTAVRSRVSTKLSYDMYEVSCLQAVRGTPIARVGGCIMCHHEGCKGQRLPLVPAINSTGGVNRVIQRRPFSL